MFLNLVFHKILHPEFVFDYIKKIFSYLNESGAPSVYVSPNASAFALEGPESDGVCQGAGFFIGCYWNYCPVLRKEYCYVLYTICFSTTFLEMPDETVYSELFYRIRPDHWVSQYHRGLTQFLFRCIFNS